jgi:hypothetical protein
MTDSHSLLPNRVAVSEDCLYNLKPSAVRSRTYRHGISPQNKSIFSPEDICIIEIPCGRRNTYYDPASSYLRFTVKNTDAANTFYVDNLASTFIERIDVFHSSNLLDQISNYNVLASMMKDLQLSFTESQGYSSVYGTSYSTDIANVRQGIQVGVSQQVTFCIPLLGSIFSCSDKLIPIGELASDLRIEIKWENLIQSVVASDAALSAWSIIDVQFECNILELSDEGQSMVQSQTPFSQPVYIHTNSFRHYSSSLPAASAGNYTTLIAARFASLKALAVSMRRSSEINDPKSYSISCRVNPLIQSYNFRLGSAVIPQRPVSLYNSGSTGGAGEAWMETIKAFHGVNKPDMCSSLTYPVYNAIDIKTADTTQLACRFTGEGTAAGTAASTSVAANGHKFGFVIFQELESFNNKNYTMLSGINTLNSQTYFEMNLGYGATTNTTSYTLDFFSWFDQILIIDGGIMSAKF